MNSKKSRLTTIMTLFISALAIYASLKGVLDENLYRDVFLAGTISEFLIGGSIAQDIITIPLALIMAFLSVMYLIKPNFKGFIIIIGLATYFFYAYGLYTIQGQYTSIYLVYLAIFSMSIYSIILGLLSFEVEEVRHYILPKKVSLPSGIFLSTILIVLVPVWLMMISSNIAGHIPADTYGVFILDLGIVFPALGIIIVCLWLKNPFGLVLAGVALIKAFTICLSWGFAQWFGPYYGNYQLDYAMTAIPTVLTVIALILIVLYMRGLQKA